MICLADGSDLGGSLRNPASFCNVVGLRPSPGRVPSWPVSDLADTFAVEGPMARTVADAALLLTVLSGPDPRVPLALDTPPPAVTEPAQITGLLSREMRGVRVAWSADLGLPVDPEVRASAFFAEVEFLACPATQVAPFDVELDWVHEIDGVRQETYLDWMASAYLISATGMPAISVPAGFTPSGLPVGLQLVGRRRADWALLAVARAFEAATGYARTVPGLSHLPPSQPGRRLVDHAAPVTGPAGTAGTGR